MTVNEHYYFKAVYISLVCDNLEENEPVFSVIVGYECCDYCCVTVIISLPNNKLIDIESASSFIML